MRFLIWQKLQCWLFCGRFFREVFQIVYDYNLAWGLAIHTRFDNHDLISRSHICQNHKLQIVFCLDSCPLLLKQCMVATHIKKIKHNVLCVTGVYLRNISNTIFFNFAFGCELSEPLLFLSYMLSVCVHATCSQAISYWKVNMGSLMWATHFGHRVHAKVRRTLTSFLQAVTWKNWRSPSPCCLQESNPGHWICSPLC